MLNFFQTKNTSTKHTPPIRIRKVKLCNNIIFDLEVHSLSNNVGQKCQFFLRIAREEEKNLRRNELGSPRSVI
jgi:hypothetical protein